MNTCTVTIFGRPLANMTEDNANYFRAVVAELDGCEDCHNYQESHALWSLWCDQRARLLTFDTVGPV